MKTFVRTAMFKGALAMFALLSVPMFTARAGYDDAEQEFVIVEQQPVAEEIIVVEQAPVAQQAPVTRARRVGAPAAEQSSQSSRRDSRNPSRYFPFSLATEPVRSLWDTKQDHEERLSGDPLRGVYEIEDIPGGIVSRVTGRWNSDSDTDA